MSLAHHRRNDVFSSTRAVKFVSSSSIKNGREEDLLHVEVPVKFVAHNIDAPPSQVVETSKEEIVEMFTQAYLMRRLEIAADTLYKSKFIRGFCHLYDGQEAVVVGMERALTRDDAVVTSYRDHCTHLGRGGTALEVMAELMGRVDGASKGMGGSMHMYIGELLRRERHRRRADADWSWISVRV